MKRYFHRIRRDICRWIMGFDNCPSSYRYDPWRKVTNAIICIMFTLGILAFFFMLLIYL